MNENTCWYQGILLHITSSTLQQSDSQVSNLLRNVTFMRSSEVNYFDTTNEYPDAKIVDRSGLKKVIMSLSSTVVG